MGEPTREPAQMGTDDLYVLIQMKPGGATGVSPTDKKSSSFSRELPHRTVELALRRTRRISLRVVAPAQVVGDFQAV